MNKTLAAVVCIAAPALLLSACTGNGAGTVPNTSQANVSWQTRVHRNDNGPQALHAGGADFPGIAYNLEQQPVGYYNDPTQPGPAAGSLFASANTTGTIYYCLANSGAGRKAYIGSGDAQAPPTGPCAALGQTPTGFGGRQDPLDFVGSSVALSSTEYATYKQIREPASGTNWGEPFEIPHIGGPIVYAFHAGTFTAAKVKLSAWSYCAIANGTVSNWNDPALTADNGGVSLTNGVAKPIDFYFRADSSGATYAYTNHLNSACNVSWKKPYGKPPYQSPGHSAAWPYGVNNVWPGPGSSGNPNPQFIGENGSPGIVAAIEADQNGTGYVEGAYAKAGAPTIAQAMLQNGSANGVPVFVDPTNKPAVVNALKNLTSASITYGEGSDGVQIGTTRPECVLYVDPSHFVLPPPKSYPIVAITYLLFYSQNNGVHVADKKKLINFIVTAKANKIVNGFEYASLPASIETAVTNALNGNQSVKPCLQ
jgi:ABC-type phosphate transport system substrate-binding protein